MLTNNKKNFVRSISMLLAMLMVLAVCLTGCGNNKALAKAEEAKTAADAVTEALEGYIKADDKDAVAALVAEALKNGANSAAAEALAAQLDAYIQSEDTIGLIKDALVNFELAGNVLTKTELEEILKDYYTKEEVDAKFESYFGEFSAEQIQKLMTDLDKAMNLDEWNEASDLVIETIADMQTLLKAIYGAEAKHYTQANMALVNEKLARLNIAPFVTVGTGENAYLAPAAEAELAKLLEYTILRVATVEEMTALKADVAAAVAVDTFESEFAALKADLFAMGELVVLGDYTGTNGAFKAYTYKDTFGATADTTYHGVDYAKDANVVAQVVTLADEDAFNAFNKAYDALLVEYTSDRVAAALKADAVEGFIADQVVYNVWKSVDDNGLVSYTLTTSTDAVVGAVKVGQTVATASDVDFLNELYVGTDDDAIVLNPTLADSNDVEAEAMNLQEAANDYKATKKYATATEGFMTDAAGYVANEWMAAYAAIAMNLGRAQEAVNAMDEAFVNDINNDNTASFLNSTIRNAVATLAAKKYKDVTDAEYVAALTAAMCEPQATATCAHGSDDYLCCITALYQYAMIVNGQNTEVAERYVDKYDLYLQLVDKAYDQLWNKYKTQASQLATQILNDYLSVIYQANADATENALTNHMSYDRLKQAMVDGGEAQDGELALTDGFLHAFLNGGDVAGIYAKLEKDFDAHNLAMYYENNGLASYETTQKTVDATQKSEEMIANPMATVKKNALDIAQRLTGAKLYTDLQIAGADLATMKASGVPVQEAFYEILKACIADLDEIYNRFFVYNPNGLSDYAMMTMNNMVAKTEELVGFYNEYPASGTEDAKFINQMKLYMTGVAGSAYGTTPTSSNGKIVNLTVNKNELESSLKNLTLLNNLKGITINLYDTSSGEGVAKVGAEAMAKVDEYAAAATATIENVLVKKNFLGYLETARANWATLYIGYSKVLADVYNYEMMLKVNTLNTQVNDTITVLQYYANHDGIELDAYKATYVNEVLALIGGKDLTGAVEARLALLSGKAIEEILADATIADKAWENAIKAVKTSNELPTGAAWEQAPVVPAFYTACDADTYLYAGTAAAELDEIVNAGYATYKTTDNVIKNLY